MPTAIKELQVEWPVISGAPWSFAIAVAIFCGALWIFLEVLHRKQIANKDSTIESHKRKWSHR